MAGFKKHIEVASITSGLLATSAVGTNFINTTEAIVLWLLGTLGGILPDIDSDNSTTLNVIFSILSLIVTCLILGAFAQTLAIPELWGVIILGNLALHFIVRPIFEKFTVHRGIFHSILCGFMFFAGTATAANYFFNTTPVYSWMLGGFVLFGFLIHLTLDELYSVDFMNIEIKRSFGTALKIYQYDNLRTTAMMLGFTAALLYLAPTSEDVVELVADPSTLEQIKQAFELTWI